MTVSAGMLNNLLRQSAPKQHDEPVSLGLRDEGADSFHAVFDSQAVQLELSAPLESNADLGAVSISPLSDDPSVDAPAREDVVALLEGMLAELEQAGLSAEQIQDLKQSVSSIVQSEGSAEFVGAVDALASMIQDTWVKIERSESISEEVAARFSQLDSALASLVAPSVRRTELGLEGVRSDLVGTNRQAPVLVGAGGTSSAMLRAIASPVLVQQSHSISSINEFAAAPLFLEATKTTLSNGLSGAVVSDSAISSLTPVQPGIPAGKLEFNAQIHQRELGSADALSGRLSAILGDKITIQLTSKAKDSIATVRLDPPELGRIDVRVRVDGDRISVNVFPTNAITREAMDASLDRLRADLQGALGGVGVDVAMDREGRDFNSAEHDFEESLVGTTDPINNEELNAAELSQKSEGIVAKA